MSELPADLRATLDQHGQAHLLAGWDALPPDARADLAAQLGRIDFAELAGLYRKKHEPAAALPAAERIRAIPVEDGGNLPVSASDAGEAALKVGQVAVLVVAGGQGTRLGFPKPKGMYPVGPVSGAPLFQIHAEKVLALSRRHGVQVPFLVMTSNATHADTVAFFEANRFFGLDAGQVHFFEQGLMPALDLETGKLLLEGPGKLFLSPNGHGGTLTALADSGLLAKLESQGVRHVFYFQVDNPLVTVADPFFLGRHIETNSEASSRVVFKEEPGEKVGVLALVDGRCSILEYSDMPAAMQAEREPDGTLRYRAGNPAIHLFSVPFLKRVTTGADRLPFHLARKKVPFWDAATGQTVTPTKENALKFELFVFDALPLADRWLCVSARREDEFGPLKNATGNDSAETCKRLQSERAARWLAAAGAVVPRTDAGELLYPVEIRPTFALDAAEAARKLTGGLTVSGPTVLE